MPRMLKTLALALATAAGSALAGEAAVTDADVVVLNDGRIQVSATVRHDDAGWDHYADRFEVLDADRNVITTRVLMHPHVDEQPFTRSTEPFPLPEGLDEITVRAHDTEHGHGGETVTVKIER